MDHFFGQLFEITLSFIPLPDSWNKPRAFLIVASIFVLALITFILVADHFNH